MMFITTTSMIMMIMKINMMNMKPLEVWTCNRAEDLKKKKMKMKKKKKMMMMTTTMMMIMIMILSCKEFDIQDKTVMTINQLFNQSFNFR